MDSKLITCFWDGDRMIPLPRFKSMCDEYFTERSTYTLEVIESRSYKSHRQYFARLHDIWETLPEHRASQFLSVDELRKHALIRCGYYVSQQIAIPDKELARDVARFARSVATDYNIILIHDGVVVVYTAQSQSYKAMGNKTFEESKRDVLEYCEGLLEEPLPSVPDQKGEAAAL